MAVRLQQAEAIVNFLNWLVGPDGQAIAESVNYASLPPEASAVAKNILRQSHIMANQFLNN